MQKVLSWAEQTIGKITNTSDNSWPLIGYTQVHRLKTASGDYFLKKHSLRGKYLQEKRAYQDWAINLKNTPDLLAFADDDMFLLMSAVRGELVESNNFSKKELHEIYNQAGTLLKDFHNIRIIDNDKLSIQQAYKKRLKAWLPRAKPMLAQKDIDWVEARALEILPNLENFKRVPCHRDFTARNWLYDGNKLSLIDFEHSRPDFFLADLERLWGSVFMIDSDIKESFFAGYGNLSSDDIEILKRSTAVWALNTISWANEHNDKVFEEHGREVLQRLQATS